MLHIKYFCGSFNVDFRKINQERECYGSLDKNARNSDGNVAGKGVIERHAEFLF